MLVGPDLTYNDSGEYRDVFVTKIRFIPAAYVDDDNTAGPWTKAGGAQPDDWPQWMRKFKDY